MKGRRSLGPSRSRASTLAELIVAVAVTSIVVVLLSRVFAATSSQWQAADQRIDAFRDARTALHVIGRDLGRANLNGDAKMLRLSNNDPNGEYAQEAFAITPTPNSGKSDLSAVGYYCAWNSSTKTYTLKRLLRDSDTILPLLQTSDFDTMYKKGGTGEEDVAAYVWDLRFYVGIDDNTVPIAAAGEATTWHWIEARFKAMSPAAARKIGGFSTIDEAVWKDPSTDLYKRLILPFEQQFVTRIILQQNR